jgi:hypothetical protein
MPALNQDLKKPVVVRTVQDLHRLVAVVGPLVPVSIAAEFQGVSRQAIYARASGTWLVGGMIMVPVEGCHPDNLPSSSGSESLGSS